MTDNKLLFLEKSIKQQYNELKENYSSELVEEKTTYFLKYKITILGIPFWIKYKELVSRSMGDCENEVVYEESPKLIIDRFMCNRTKDIISLVISHSNESN